MRRLKIFGELAEMKINKQKVQMLVKSMNEDHQSRKQDQIGKQN